MGSAAPNPDASALLWAAFDWGDDTLWGVAITEADLAYIRLSLRKWQGARDRVARLVFTFNAVLWGTEVWGAFDWGAGGDPTSIGQVSTWGTFDWGTNAWAAFYFD